VSGENIFVKIRQDDKFQIFNDLTSQRGMISAKLLNPESLLYELQCQSISNTALFVKAPIELFKFFGERQLITQFSIGGEKYLAQMKYSTSGESLSLSLEGDLFRLQRREDFRLKFPPSFKAKFEIKTHNSKSANFSTQILDMSAGGCRLIIKTDLNTFTKNDKAEGKLLLQDREPYELKLEIMHIMKDSIDEKQVQLGCKFFDQNAKEKNRLSTLVMDVYREIYSRM
jgi:hypothetical protein